MKALNWVLTALLLGSGAVISGCATDVPLISNQRAVRIEGVELYNRGDYENAAGAFRNAVQQDPRDFRSQYYLGLNYEKLNNFQQAIQAYKSALKIMRQTPAGRDAVDFRQVVMNTLASCLAKHDQDSSEYNLLQQQAKDLSLPSEIRAENYFLLSKINRYRRDADSALQTYFFGSELDAKDLWLQKEAGLYMYHLGKKFTAAKPLQRAVALDSRDQEVIAAMQDLKLRLPAQLMKSTQGAPQPLFQPVPLPAVELKVGDSPVELPNELPVD